MSSRPPALCAIALALLVACGGSHGDDGDDADDDDGPGDGDAALADATGTDGAALDAAAIDAAAIAARPPDAAVDAMADAAPTTQNHIHTQVSNTCVMTVTPMSITVPADQTAYFDWHNHSVDYP